MKPSSLFSSSHHHFCSPLRRLISHLSTTGSSLIPHETIILHLHFTQTSLLSSSQLPSLLSSSHHQTCTSPDAKTTLYHEKIEKKRKEKSEKEKKMMKKRRREEKRREKKGEKRMGEL
jgi:hypothetical protein